MSEIKNLRPSDYPFPQLTEIAGGGCTSHHSACECCEALMAQSMQTQRRVIDWRNQSDEGLRLRCGELSAQEIRTVRAVLNAVLQPNA